MYNNNNNVMKRLGIVTIIITILTAIAWFGYLLADVNILTPLVGNVLQIVLLIMIIKEYKSTKINEDITKTIY